MQRPFLYHFLISFIIVLFFAWFASAASIHYLASIIESVADPLKSTIQPLSAELVRKEQIGVTLFWGIGAIVSFLLTLANKKYSTKNNSVRSYYSKLIILFSAFIAGTLINVSIFQLYGDYFLNIQIDDSIINEIDLNQMNTFKYGYFFASLGIFFLGALEGYNYLKKQAA